MADELDELSKKLFASARAERATEEIRSRILDASSAPVDVGTSSRTTTIIGAAALAAGVAGLFWFGERGVGTVTVDRETLPTTPATKPASNPPEARRDGAERPADEPAKLGASARPSASVERAPASLSDELVLVESARSALASGASERALELLDRYERTLGGTRLRAEASILRMEALAASGRSAEAASLAGEFVKNNPGSPLVDRARSFARDGQSGPSDQNQDQDQDPGRTP